MLSPICGESVFLDRLPSFWGLDISVCEAMHVFYSKGIIHKMFKSLNESKEESPFFQRLCTLLEDMRVPRTATRIAFGNPLRWKAKVHHKFIHFGDSMLHLAGFSDDIVEKFAKLSQILLAIGKHGTFHELTPKRIDDLEKQFRDWLLSLGRIYTLLIFACVKLHRATHLFDTLGDNGGRAEASSAMAFESFNSVFKSSLHGSHQLLPGINRNLKAQDYGFHYRKQLKAHQRQTCFESF